MRRPPSGVCSTVLSGSREMSISRSRTLDVVFHQVDEVGAAGNELRRRVGRELPHGVGDVGCARILEIDHDLCHRRHRLLDRGDDVGIGAAAADVAAHQLADFVGGRRPALRDEARGRADLTGRAVAALECVVVDEGLLQRMQRAVGGEPLDGGDLGAVLHDDQRQAGIDAPAVDQDRAGAALALIAALLGAGQIETVAQRVEQGRPGRDGQRTFLAVDVKRDGQRRRCRDTFIAPCGSRKNFLAMRTSKPFQRRRPRVDAEGFLSTERRAAAICSMTM